MTWGFLKKNHHKEVYFDGHERDGVVFYRRQFVTKFLDLQHRCMFPNHAIECSIRMSDP